MKGLEIVNGLMIGFREDTAPAQIAHELELTVGVSFQLHESSFLGEYYQARLGGFGGETLTLRANRSSAEADPPAPQHEDVNVVLTIMNSGRQDVLKQAILQLVQFSPIVLSE